VKLYNDISIPHPQTPVWECPRSKNRDRGAKKRMLK